MAISLTYLNAYLPTANITEGTVAVGQPVPAGAILIVTAHMGGVHTGTSLQDSQVNSWTTIPPGSIDNPASTTQVFHSTITNPLTSTDTVTLSGKSSGAVMMHIYMATGASAIAEPQSSSGTSSAPATMPNAIGSDAGSIILYALTSRNDMTVSSTDLILDRTTPAAGGTNTRAGAILYRASSSSESITPSATSSPSAGWSGTAFEITALSAATPQGDYEILRSVAGVVTAYELVRSIGGVVTKYELVRSNNTEGGLGAAPLGVAPLGN